MTSAAQHSYPNADYLAEVRRIVDLAPKLTAAQRDLIATILRPSAGGDAA
jgi:hypothetical protein